MQEFKYFRDGGTLVITLDGLNWLSQRRCKDKGVKKRDEELRLLVSSGQMVQAGEEQQPIAFMCVFDQRGSGVPRSWRNTDLRSSLVARPPSSSGSPRHVSLTEKPTLHSALLPVASFVSEAPWTRLVLNMQDIFSLIKKDFNIVTQQDALVTKQQNRFIIFCDEDIPLQRFGGTCYAENYGTSIEDTGWQICGNSVLNDSKYSAAHCPHGANTDNSEGIQHELVNKDYFNTCGLRGPLKSCQINKASRVLKRRRVSFDDDVMVYLFDQESPTVELLSGPCTSPPGSYSSNQPDITLEDSGLEWEDDFSALEKSCHFQCVRHSAPHQHYSLSLPTQSISALSRRFFLSQTCLFLTHVTESDLEL